MKQIEKNKEVNYKVGDRIVVVRDDKLNSHIKAGMMGHIVAAKYNNSDKNYYMGVMFDEYIDGHDCDYNCKYGYGWYVWSDEILRMSNEENTNYTISLRKTKWVELCEKISSDGSRYTFIREPWLINGEAVAILPLRTNKDNEIEFLVRYENADIPVVGAIKGGCDKEGESAIETAVRELFEEAGYHAEEKDMVRLGAVRPSKLNTTTMNLFGVDITNLKYTKPVGDGTANEKNAYCKWVKFEDLILLQDSVIHSLLIRSAFI